MLQAKEHAPTPCSSTISTLDSHWSLLKSLGARQFQEALQFKAIIILLL
jgi:hypothetical protein